MATWPVSLPALTEFLDGSYVEQTPDNVIQTRMDAGPPKSRQRSTAKFRIIKGTLYMTAAQVATHDTFFVTTTNMGQDEWDATAPRTGASENFKYVRPPSYKSIGQGYHVDLELMLMP